MLRMAVGRNLVMSVLRRISPGGLMSAAREAAAVSRSLGQFDIRPKQPGDRRRRAVRAATSRRWCSPRRSSTSRRLLLLDEPTRGVDVGAKGEIYARLRELAAQGLGILVASSEMPELIGLCDRIVVLREGRNVAEFSGRVDEHTVLAAANGRDALMSEASGQPAGSPPAAPPSGAIRWR